MEPGSGVRNHEPSLRELTAELDGVRSLLLEKISSLEKLGDERDVRYTERSKSTDEKTGLALTASKEAVTKAEAATEKRFDSVNEFRKTLSDQTSSFATRAEVDLRIQGLDDKLGSTKESLTKEIQSLREFRSQTSGEGIAKASVKEQSNFVIGIWAVVAVGILDALATLALLFQHGK